LKPTCRYRFARKTGFAIDAAVTSRSTCVSTLVQIATASVVDLDINSSAEGAISTPSEELTLCVASASMS
jgi:hypothetical protein